LNVRTALLGLFVALAILFASTSFYESTSRITSTSTSTLTESATRTITVTSTPSFSGYPVTFLTEPTQCYIEALCVNATLVSHVGENLTVILAAWIRNATTGQNLTNIGNGKDSTGYATCTATVSAAQKCYLVAYPTPSLGTFQVTIYVVSSDGKTVLSPSETINATLH